MHLTHLLSYLISPGKNLEHPPTIQGADLPSTGNLYSMLNRVFDNSDTECRIPIRFTIGSDGNQFNPVRSEILALLVDPTIDSGMILANRLRDVTTNKSGLGLMFILIGQNEGDYKVVISRFPADQGVVAEARRGTLDVQFVERIFMKNSTSYKAALYRGQSFDADFWSGHAVDKQLDRMANYWIREFLESDFLTTSKEGTRIFARALRAASQSAEDIQSRQEIVALSTLIKRMANQAISVEQLIERFNLSDQAAKAIILNLPHPDIAEATFQIDADEFSKHAPFASVTLDNGGIMLAPPDKFNDCFEREAIDQDKGEYRFSTVGHIVDERIRGHR
jgi:hypothetical protein